MQEINALIAPEMQALEEHMQALVKSDGHLLQQVTQHTFQAPGKQLRPMLVFLGAGTCGSINDKVLRGAVLVALLHQASLAHDDVVDEATHRRGRPAINTVWDNKIAILFGDYLLAKSLQMATQHKDYDFLALIAETVQAMSEGELLQLEKIHTYDTTESVYLDIIYKKTAHFWGTCLAVGATAAGALVAQVATLRQVGEQLGMAFQLKDDWLDYRTEDTGKPLGMDLKKGQLTLPLIHTLQQAPEQKKKRMQDALKQGRDHPQQQAEILAFIRQSPGMDYTQEMILQYQKKALHTLSKTNSSPYQEALHTLIQHII